MGFKNLSQLTCALEDLISVSIFVFLNYFENSSKNFLSYELMKLVFVTEF
jgi:hypothetical protein